MSTTNKENENSTNESNIDSSGGSGLKQEHLNQASKGSPYRKNIANKNYEQLEATTQKLLSDFGKYKITYFKKS